MKTFFIRLILSLVIATGASNASPKAMIIFDASGSMWGQIDGINKIVIARDALKSVVEKWNPGIALGLTVYGHRVKGDCNDIETLIPIGRVDKQRMIDTVNHIVPKGMTPIAKSLRLVADKLRSNEDTTTIILISDGRESCDADPCATAKQLKAEGINFVAHVVGFNVDARTDRQLACIAKATGGEYFSAKNAAALTRAIKTIAKKVEKPKPKPKPKAPTQTILSLKARYNMIPDGLDISGVQWRVTQEEKTLYKGSESNPKIPAAVGKVHIDATYARTDTVQTIAGDVALAAKKINPVIIQLKSGKVLIDAAEEEGGPKVKASVHIYPVLDGEPDLNNEIAWCIPTPKKACEKVLPVGSFYLKATYNELQTERTFSLKNKETQTIHLSFSRTGTIETSASETEGGKWVRASHVVYENDDGKIGDHICSPMSHKKSSGKCKLPVGKYIVKSSYKDFEKITLVTVKPGETTKVHVVFGPFHVSAKGINPCTRIHIELVSPRGQVVAEKEAPAAEGADFVVPDGEYFVEISAGDQRKRYKASIRGGGELVGDFGGAQTQRSIEGVWKTSEGIATLRLQGTQLHGTYSSDNGELVGEMTYPQRFEGFWIEDSSNEKCAAPKNGRYYWGRVIWTFDDHLCSFRGKWSYCDAKPDSRWSGHYLHALPSEKPRAAVPSTPATQPNATQQRANASTPPSEQEAPLDRQIMELGKAAEAITRQVKDSAVEHADDIKKMGKMLDALGTFLNSASSSSGRTERNGTDSPVKNDKELEEMGKDLEMFSK